MKFLLSIGGALTLALLGLFVVGCESTTPQESQLISCYDKQIECINTQSCDVWSNYGAEHCTGNSWAERCTNACKNEPGYLFNCSGFCYDFVPGTPG